MKRAVFYLILILPVLLHSMGKDRPLSPEATASPETRFVDGNHDGLNDLAADRDADGRPDALQLDSLELRWALFRAVPDSVGGDSLAFSRWWRRVHGNDPALAWSNWQSWTRKELGCGCGCIRCRCSH